MPTAIKGIAKRALGEVVKWTVAGGMRPRATNAKLMMALNGDALRVTTEAYAKGNYAGVTRPLPDEPAQRVQQQVAPGGVASPTNQEPEIKRNSET